MVPSGPPTPAGGGAQQMPASLMRVNSGLIGGQSMASQQQQLQQGFPNLISPRTQYNSSSNNNSNTVLGSSGGNGMGVSSILGNHNFGATTNNNGTSINPSVEMAEPDPLSAVSNGMGGGFATIAAASNSMTFGESKDNNIEFWRKFVAEYYAPNAKKRWCVSLYGSGRQTTGVFPQDVWHCEICNRRPGRGFETTVEVLPRLCKIKYDSGTLEELLYVDMPREYQNVSGQIVLDYAKAIQESVFEQLRVVRDGQLRIVFSPDLKIVSWEFCARRHEELIPRRLIIPQVSQLGTVAQKYQAATQNATSNLSTQELQNSCNLFVASARQLAKSLEVPLVNDLGYTKRYVRCLQISEVVNSMKDLIDYSRETGSGPMASLINFPRRTSTSSTLHSQGLQPDEQAIGQSSNNDQNPTQSAPGQLSAGNNGIVNVNKTLSSPSTSAPTSTIVSLLHQNSMNSRQQQPSQENPMSNSNSSYDPIRQLVNLSSTTTQSQTNLPSSPFPSPPLSSSNNPTQASPRNVLPSSGTTSHLNSTNLPGNVIPQQLTAQSNEADPNDSQIAMQQLLQEIIMSTQGGALGNDMKGMNDISSVTINGGLVGSNGMTSSSGGIGGMGFGNMGGMGSSATVSGIRAAMTNNAMALNGRIGGMNSMVQDSTMNSHPQQQDTGNRLTSGLGTLNNFNNQFDF
ncbi:Transcriptional corepressor SEUSS [Acorus calamus]|uniref:Transcriptional corepressor SEUSS n=1 Tax=Acorus calamus TaxID=4465 RepID=A0AAV9DGK4_ACOCL|nr:Transcriptional corepressor SEUSS [Acorus calamus]